MAPNDLLRHRVRIRAESEDREEDESDIASSGQPSGGSDSDDVLEAEPDAVEDGASPVGGSEDESDHSGASTGLQTNLKDISFGALAQAQASFGKRKRTTGNSNSQPPSALEGIRKRLRESRGGAGTEAPPDRNKGKFSKPPPRTSHHAPTAQSSRHAVSRKRIVIEPTTTLKPRDPRFDNQLQDHQTRAASTAALSRNYSFLSTYQDAEMSDLRTQIKKAKDPVTKADLKKTLMSMQNRRKAAEAAELERDVMRQHRKKEKELIKEGKKERPWFLKKGDVKKEVLAEKFKGMKDKEREAALAKRRKRKASKEKKGMPLGRRGLETEA